MSKPAGYLTNTKTGLQGEHGFIYDYILAENGLFLEARSPLLGARICIAPAVVRGLAPADHNITLMKGLVPGHLYQLALSVLCIDPYRECYVAITWDDEYHIKMPAQNRQESKVVYDVLPSTLIDIHSHGTLGAFYSHQWDDRDEQGFRLSLVAGKMDTPAPEMEMRLVMYGYFAPVAIEEVFCTP